MEGRITPGAAEPEWCERHLLARIHRYTLNRLRREIEPVEPRNFQRFVFAWQHVGEGAQVSGREALPAVLAQLEGFEAPAALWEAELLPARVADFNPAWLDELCTAGRTVWARLRPGQATAAAGRATLRAAPIVLLPRRGLALWSGIAAGDDRAGGAAPADADAARATGAPSARAQRVLDALQVHGASFFDDLLHHTRLLRTELEDALAELVARGAVHGDSYAGLRALMLPPSKRAASARRAPRRGGFSGIEDAGRWTAVRPPAKDGGAVGHGASATTPDDDAVEHVARTLLRRWGVVCWRLLEREAAWLPPWRDLVRVYRRLEARGEIRGGRFIAGLAGEQFALPDAVGALRSVRREAEHDPDAGPLVVLAAADPANLLGSVLHGPRVPRIAGARLLYRGGLALASLAGGELEWLVPDLPNALREQGARLLRLEPGSRHSVHGGLVAALAARPG
jgi:ATP-dependent Lhr-like helicase